MSFSDHAAVSFSLLSKEYEKRRPGFFKYNNSLLDDKNFVEELKENIEKYKENYRCLTDKRLLLGNDQDGNLKLHFILFQKASQTAQK